MNAPPQFENNTQVGTTNTTGYLWAYNFISFALLIDVAYRAFVYQEAAWDLIALVVFGGAFCAHPAKHINIGFDLKAIRKLLIVIACIAFALGAILPFLR